MQRPEAWYMDDLDADQRQPHKLEPNQPVSGKQLEELGVLHWVLDADNYETDPELQKIRKDRNYSYQVRQLVGKSRELLLQTIARQTRRCNKSERIGTTATLAATG
jgi:hypothetical protein